MSNVHALLTFSGAFSNPKLKIVHAAEIECAGNADGSFSAVARGDLYNYLFNAVRLDAGDEFILIEYSKKRMFFAAVSNIKKKEALLALRRLEDDRGPARGPFISVFVAALKGVKNAEVCEKLTELGISAVYFYNSEHSVGRVEADKIERLKKVAESASSQSRRAWPPEVGVVDYNEILDLAKSKKALCAVMIEPSAAGAAADDVKNTLGRLKMKAGETAGRDIFIISGAEGGFSNKEIAALAQTMSQSCGDGFEIFPITLADCVLRAELAPVVAAAIIKYECGGF